MTALVLAMLACLLLAAAVLAVVAVPRLRGGDRLLTSEGADAVSRTAGRARTGVAAVRSRVRPARPGDPHVVDVRDAAGASDVRDAAGGDDVRDLDVREGSRAGAAASAAPDEGPRAAG